MRRCGTGLDGRRITRRHNPGPLLEHRDLHTGAPAGKGGSHADPRFEGSHDRTARRFAEGLRHRLLRRGYTPLSTANVLRLAAHLSRWMNRERVPAGSYARPSRGSCVRHRRQAATPGVPVDRAYARSVVPRVGRGHRVATGRPAPRAHYSSATTNTHPRAGLTAPMCASTPPQRHDVGHACRVRRLTAADVTASSCERPDDTARDDEAHGHRLRAFLRYPST